MAKIKGGAKAKTYVTPTRDILYAEAAKYAPRAIEILAEIMEKGDNDNSRMGAAKTILAKAIPDLKSIELTGENNAPIQIRIVEDKIVNEDEK